MTEKISPSSSLLYPPTPRQIRAISKMAQALGDQSGIEHDPMNRREARDLIFKLRIQLKERREL